ncbi:hypothetical protein PMm318_A37720 [Pseudomonas moorei]
MLLSVVFNLQWRVSARRHRHRIKDREYRMLPAEAVTTDRHSRPVGRLTVGNPVITGNPPWSAIRE